MSLRQKIGDFRSSELDVEKSVVVVAVKFSKEISRTALKWALTNVAKPGDCVRLLVVIPIHSSSKKLWGFPKIGSDCSTGSWRSMSGTVLDQKDHITELCNQMMSQLQDIYDPEKVRVKMKMVYESEDGVVASEAKRTQTKWVVLEKRMKKEANFCMEQLDCNLVVVKNSEAQLLRLNLIEPTEKEINTLPDSASSMKYLKDEFNSMKVLNVTPTSSPEHTSFKTTVDRISSISSFSEINWDLRVNNILPSLRGHHDFEESDSESASENPSSLSTSISSQQWIEDLSSADESSKQLNESIQEPGSTAQSERNQDFRKNVREIMLPNKNARHDPPPLCTVCRHKTPSFGNPPRLFSYAELEQATSVFSKDNFLAEGGYGSVHRGVLPDGLVIAVKQHKLASTQGDREFCSEVQVLSCAQHRNVVMLIGYCLENRRRLLVYEFICNGSLDSHLYGHSYDPLDWTARRKIAIGAARGLRYLHEECRIGCIVHRDMRPNNILLTHDFEPLVGDFGLARFQPDGDSGAETRIIGTFGYLAPEYAQTGQVSDKADVYSFGVVLVELVTGRKAVDINLPKGEQCLTEWARPLLEENAFWKLVDPRLNGCYSETEVQGMIHAASLCIQRDPESRPRMSQVLRMLEDYTYI
ncbi:inactive protein kinase SELMODRAFT_444075-like [Primulina huaijiensis]|uniref:inactive protein kinase SELMODRAFT_444075-like n=1 Tax=Primulina huaijiensis TaxID=1492673 RepID=UPI003CC785EB